LLLYFKYAGFLAQNLHLAFGVEINQNLLPQRLPIGISFFTFHAISYLIDIYRGKCKAQKNFFDLALYIAFFPQLIAGPIVRYNTIVKYLQNRRHSISMAAHGVRRFIIGLGKKIIIANPLGEVADAIFSAQLDSINSTLAWVGIVCYTMQIYFDFSGYSDMAIGLARIFGFKFPENFNYPYIAKSIKEFWRRWHMSLSAWFRDYVYIPLGGNRVGLVAQYFNLVLVFFLCGLWHGASWNFVAWGLFHGFFLVFERIKFGHFLLNKLPNFLQHFYTILIIMIGWVFFRSPNISHAMGYLDLMFLHNNNVVIAGQILHLINSHLVWSVGILALIGFSPLCKNLSAKFANCGVIYSVLLDILLLLIFIVVVIRLSSATHNPFIYFQF
jgi:alginate O-acetyltransferase complex protein AlgI